MDRQPEITAVVYWGVYSSISVYFRRRELHTWLNGGTMTEKKQIEPDFHNDALNWGQTVLIQALIVQLITTKVLTVEQAEEVFDMALARTDKEKHWLPDASRFVEHVHDNLKWDEYYKWSALNRKGPSGDQP